MAYLLHQLLERSAATRPEAEAVVDRERSITYRELNDGANRLANLLVALGVGHGDRVGLCLEKSLESILGIYGVLKAGAVYVPLDPQAPPARLASIAADCGIRHLLSAAAKAASWPLLSAAGAPLEVVVVLDGETADLPAPSGLRLVGASALESQPTVAPTASVIDLDLAYILYTSGSTGTAKGVMLSHLNAMAFVDWGVEQFSLRPADRLANHAPLHFDLSVFDIFAAAAAGAAVVLVPRSVSVFPTAVAGFIAQNRITVWYSVPSILSMVTLHGGLGVGDLAELRLVLFAGEVFPTRYLRQLMAQLPSAAFHNLYGPTETNVCTHFAVPPLSQDQTQPIPIGRAIANVEVFAVTEDGKRASRGETGELYVRGTTVMGGYWGDPERTSKVLVANPLADALPDPACRTGDLVREDDDGNYHFLGRRDSQIKSRGYRIEPGDIEAALYTNPAVRECAVVAVPDELVTNRLKAYVAVGSEVDGPALARACSEVLPRYMIPDVFELMGTLPKTSTGKIDRQALSNRGSVTDSAPTP